MGKRDKIALGLLLFAGAGILIVVALPIWDSFNANMAKKNQDEAGIASLTEKINSLNTEIQAIQSDVPMPSGVEVRKFKTDSREEVVKDIVDNVVKKATAPGNKLVYLLPFPADPIKPPLTPEQEQAVKDGKMSEPASPYDTIGYDLAVRGTYGSIQDFLSALDNQREIVEVVSIALVNEAGVDRAGTKPPNFNISGADVILDPSKPIRLTAKLRLILERQD